MYFISVLRYVFGKSEFSSGLFINNMVGPLKMLIMILICKVASLVYVEFLPLFLVCLNSWLPD